MGRPGGIREVHRRRKSACPQNRKEGGQGLSGNGKAYGPVKSTRPRQLRTELVWEGKYNEYGNWRAGDVAGLALPMQKIETIDQPRSKVAAAGQLDMFEQKTITDPKEAQQNLVLWINGLGALVEAEQ